VVPTSVPALKVVEITALPIVESGAYKEPEEIEPLTVIFPLVTSMFPLVIFKAPDKFNVPELTFV